MREGAARQVDCGWSDGPFVGRDAELARMSEVCAVVARGVPRTVWVRGDAGIGKTRFVRRAVLGPDAPPFTVLDATADVAESVLEFGLVEQIVRRADPAVLGSTLGSTSLLSGNIPSDASPFAVGAQLLRVLGAMQSAGPVAVIVDDVHWTDARSAQVLGFVLRRARADHVLTVLLSRHSAEHDPESPLHRLERCCPDAATIELTGLTSQDVGVMAALHGYELPTRAVRRLRAHTDGNPLHVRTLLHELPEDVLGGEHLALPAPRSLVTAVRSTLDRLPRQTRALLEALAVLVEVTPLARAAYVAGVDDAARAVGPGLDAGLLRWVSREPSSPLCIGHGLRREAIYDVIPPERRQVLHRRAAEIADPVSRWGHLVAAASTTDPDLAAELDDAASEAGDRGQHMLAARYLRWAADLSARRTDYERRLLTSYVQSLLGPHRDSVLDRRPDIERCAPTALRSLALGMVALLADGDRAEATRYLSGALERSAETWIRAMAAAGLAGATLWTGPAEETIRTARLALSFACLPPRLADLVRVFLAVARCRVDGMAAGLAELTHLPSDAVDVPPEHLDSLACRGAIRTMLGHFPAAELDLRTAVRRHQTGPHTFAGTAPHSYLAVIHYARGEWEDASILAHQALSLADPDERPHHRVLRHVAACLVPAGRGEWAVANAHLSTAWATANRSASPHDTRSAAIAEATLHQARGRPADMLTALRKMIHDEQAENSGADGWWALWWRPLLIEALLGTGHRGEAAEHLAQLRRLAADAEYLSPTILRFDIALSDGTGPRRAQDRVAELAEHAPRHSFLQALLEACFGARLAATGRPAEATRYLTTARHRFADLRAVPFEQRTRTAIERHTPAAPPTGRQLPGLSRRESQIAHLVQLNHTNREIAAQLYVTTKTVEYHLANIFLKLGITSRRQLRDQGSGPQHHP
nr:regulatory protein, LuxR [Kibdelosporangium sp. MJ126-NF4]CTQ98488.1 regulatory protein, LuxR [Kibdelosporangium sp. MJ126-NF4]